jgi:hypothetical protein
MPLAAVVRADADADVADLGFLPQQQWQRQRQQQGLQPASSGYTADPQLNIGTAAVSAAAAAAAAAADAGIAHSAEGALLAMLPYQQQQQQQITAVAAASLPFHASSSIGQLQQINELASLDEAAAAGISAVFKAETDIQQH